MQVTARLPALPARVASPPQSKLAEERTETIRVTYHGNVFDASGYGHAARAYIHALHQAGVELSVTDLAAPRPRQVEDALVASLIGAPMNADFNLFHGIPPQWARLAFPLRNVIAMTVWETSAMPTQWRPVLTHALDIWFPCEFNASVFAAALGKPVFRLPHPIFSPGANHDGKGTPTVFEEREIRAGDFVFYAIFEWQERKAPERILEAYFRAFPADEGTVLVLKTNPGATAVANRALEEVRGRTGSQARAIVRAEAWSEDQVSALHARGDCYVSLHRGEGWCYPLFEAAARGKPVIATGYSGPLDYLCGGAHALVRHTLTAVRQPYAYYRPTMHWAEPDTGHASEHMRTIRAHPDEARERAGAVVQHLQDDFSLEAIGQRARRRLLELLHRTDRTKWERLDRTEHQLLRRPPVPIPGEWYDADYFEDGRKSNWKDGYHWRHFAGLFRDTAEFLTTIFTEAHSFLDAGCAKGFLVRALRERQQEAWGFDHSAWALDRAEPLARPFLHQAGVENAGFDRTFDVTLAFSLLESLTEEQALAFLRRAGTWTRQALVAVICTCEDDSQRQRLADEDHDLAHVTLRSRAWWHDLILRAGWKQDPLHQFAQRVIQGTALPLRMSWQVFVYAPPPGEDRGNP